MKWRILDIVALAQKYFLSPALLPVVISGCLLLAAVSLIDGALAIGVILSVFLLCLTLFFIDKYGEEGERARLKKLFIIAFLIHIGVVLFIYYANFQPFSGGYGDYVIYQRQGEEIAQRVHQGNLSLEGIFLGVNHYYPVIIGYLYTITLPSMLMGQLLNAWLVALAVILVYLLARQIGGNKNSSFLAALAAVFYPSLAFYGSLMLKDALVATVALAGLLLAVRIIKNFSIPAFALFFAVLIAIVNIRFYVGYAVMFSFIISWFIASPITFKKRFFYGVVMIALLGLVPQMLGTGYYGSNNFKQFLNAKGITYYREVVYAPPAPKAQPAAADNQPAVTPAIQVPSEPANERAEEMLKEEVKVVASDPTVPAVKNNLGHSSSVVIKTGLDNPVTFVKNSLWSFVGVLLGPFPWTFTKLRHLFSVPEVLAWWLLLFFIARGVVVSIKTGNKIVLPLLIFSGMVLGVLALFMSNFGIITRIRISAFLALLCILPLGLHNLDQNKMLEKLKTFKIPFLK